MKTPFFRHLGLLLAGCLLALTSCGVPYDNRTYVYGTGYGANAEPIPSHVIVVDRDGNAITSGYANRNSVYYGRRYYGNRYYGSMYYGYNNTPVYGAAYGYPPLDSWGQ